MHNSKPLLTGPAAEREIRRLTRRSFLTGAGAALAGFGTWRWLTTTTLEDDLNRPKPDIFVRRGTLILFILGDGTSVPQLL